MMTEQEMNVAIAEACGWRFEESIAIRPDGWRMHSYINNPKGEFTPNYTTDFNAMHEAVATLSFTQRRLYRLELQRVVSSGLKEGVLVEMSECIDATARQRAEAFLRTVGRWTE